MKKDKDYLDAESQERFERSLFALLEKEELFFPMGEIAPGPESLAAQPVKESWWRRFSTFINPVGHFFLKPAVAYVLVLGLAYPAYRGIWQKPEVVTVVEKQEVVKKEYVEVPKWVGGVGTTRTIALGFGRQRDQERESQVLLSPAEDFFTLSFSVPIKKQPTIRYDLEIRDAGGSLITEQKDKKPWDGMLNFALVCDKRFFKDGRYVLQVLEVGADGAKTERGRFPFKVAHSLK